MTVASDLQTLVARLNTWIAAGEKIGRVELEQLRREASAIREDASRLQDVAFSTEAGLREVVVALEAGAKETAKLARRARARLPEKPLEQAA